MRKLVCFIVHNSRASFAISSSSNKFTFVETLPRAKSRVRKVSADPRMAPPLLLPTNRSPGLAFTSSPNADSLNLSDSFSSVSSLEMSHSSLSTPLHTVPEKPEHTRDTSETEGFPSGIPDSCGASPPSVRKIHSDPVVHHDSVGETDDVFSASSSTSLDSAVSSRTVTVTCMPEDSPALQSAHVPATVAASVGINAETSAAETLPLAHLAHASVSVS